MHRILSYVMVLLLLLTFALPVSADAAEDVKFKISIDTDASQAGHIALNINGENLNDLYAYEAVLSYDPQDLEFVKSKAAMEGFAVPPQIEDKKVYIAFTKVGKVNGIDGNALLNKVSFKRKNSNPIKVTLESVKAVNSSLVAKTYEIGQSIQDAYYLQYPKVSDDMKTATASLSLEKYNELLKNAIGDSSGIKLIFIEINPVDTATRYVQELPSIALSATALDKNIVIRTPFGTITLPGNVISKEELNGNDTVSISIESANMPLINNEINNLVGDRPVIKVSMMSQDKNISGLKQSIKIDLPYRAKKDENSNAVIVCSIDENGKAEILKNSKYNSTIGAATFSTDYLSKFAVAYNKINFDDVDEKAYYYNAVTYLAARNITLGTGNGLFSPRGKLTRGQFMVLVMRAYGISPDENLKDNFSDAGNTYYTGYLAAAKRLGLSKGIGNNMFGPEIEISRQELFTLLYNVLKETGNLPGSDVGKDINSFNDADQVASYAKEAITFLVRTGIVQGYNNELNPRGKAERAEAVQLLYNLMSQ